MLFLGVFVDSGDSTTMVELDWGLGWELGSAMLLDSVGGFGRDRGSRKGRTLTF